LDLGAGRFTIQPVYPLTGADNVVCVLTANQAGNDKYAAAPSVSQTLTFTKQATRVVYKTSSPTVTEVGTFIYLGPQTIVGLVYGSTTPIAVTSLTPSVCTAGDYGIYNSDQGPRATVRAKANGTCSVKMDYPGNASQLASTATWTSTISGLTAPGVGANAPQTITFPAVADRNYGYSAKLLGTSTSKLPVKYTSLTPLTCFIIEQLAAGPSVQSATSTGLDKAVCTVEASQTGDDRFAAASPVQMSFNYLKAPMKLVLASAPAVMAGAGPYIFVTNVLYVESAMNSGLASLGHMLSVTSATPAICRVDSNVLWDRTGGIVNKTQVTALDNGNCQLYFYFSGTTTRAATTLVWSKIVTGFVIPTSTYIELQSLQKVISPTGNSMSLKALDAGRVIVNAFIRTPDPSLLGNNYAIQSPTDVTTLTPLVCAIDGRSINTSGSKPYTGSVIKPLKVGTCSILYSYSGDASAKQGSSSITWSATVTS